MTEYNKLVDHLVSTMKGNSMTSDVTNSPKDWEDFWYNSEDTLEGKNDNQEELKSIIKEIETQAKKPLNVQLNEMKIAGAKLILSLDKLGKQLDKIVKDNQMWKVINKLTNFVFFVILGYIIIRVLS